MRKLHLVGLTTDRDGLIFTARKGSKSGGYIVPLDEKVLAAVAQARGAPSNGSPAEAPAPAVEAVPKRLRSESALTPREMQARLRAGRSIEEVADEAGVDTEWVARFAVPILAEQAQVVELARALVYAKPRLGESSQPLGASVLMNLSDRGVFLPDDIANAGWSAFQLHDSVWMVRFRYRSRGRDQEAHWEIDVPTGRLVARNRHASDLGYVEHGRRRRDVEPEEEQAQVEEAPAPQRPVRRPAKAAPVVKAAKATGPTRATKAAKATKATKAANGAGPAPARRSPPAARPARRAPSVPARAGTKAAKAPRKAAVTAKVVRKAAPAPVKAATKATPARPAARRRPAKASPGKDAGPTAGTGGVRMAVAQVSTARVAASLAAADRAPWAAAVRRPPARSFSSPAVDGDRSARPRGPVPAEAPPEGEAAGRPTFQPRPLPPPGSEPVERRAAKVPPRRASSSSEAPPAVSLPAPRPPSPRTEPLPVERPKRRRLRSR